MYEWVDSTSEGSSTAEDAKFLMLLKLYWDKRGLEMLEDEPRLSLESLQL